MNEMSPDAARAEYVDRMMGATEPTEAEEIDVKPCDAGYEQCVEYRTSIAFQRGERMRLEQALTASTAREAALVEALQGLLHDYKQLVDSGDCGFWDSEKVPSVIAARAVLDH